MKNHRANWIHINGELVCNLAAVPYREGLPEVRIAAKGRWQRV